jgi:thioredoxin-like negative regulator of GroEL
MRLLNRFLYFLLLILGCGSSVERNIDRLADKEEKEQAMMELALAKGNAIPPLIEALNNGERPAEVRAAVAEVLFRMYVREGDSRIVPALLERLEDSNPEVRARVVEALGNIQKREVIHPLLKRLEIEQESEVQQQILDAIGSLDNWGVERSEPSGLLRITGGATMTAEERAGFIEVLKTLHGKGRGDGISEKVEEFLEEVAEQTAEEGDKLILKGDLVGAERKYQEAKALVPESKNINRKLGKFYFDNGDREKGLAILRGQGMVLDARRLSGVPTIDGNLNDLVWREAAKIDRFYQCIFQMRVIPAEGNSEVYIGYTDKAIYIAVKGYEETTKDLRANVKERDGFVHTDDCAEIFFDPDRDYNTFNQIIVNTLGTIADYVYDPRKNIFGQGAAQAWNGNFRLATKVAETFWVLEIEVPFKELGVPTPPRGAIWGFNASRVRIAHEGEYDQWVPTHGLSLRPALFGFLIFS